MCCLLIYTIWKDQSKKEKLTKEPKNCASWQSLTITLADTFLTERYVKILISFSKKLVRENKCEQKHSITCLFTSGVLPDIVFVDELYLLTRNDERKATKKEVSRKTLIIAPASKGSQTVETNRGKEKQLEVITNGWTPSIAPGFQGSPNSSTVATVSSSRPSGS